MKKTVNTKKILKATIAFSGILLAGCAPVSENGVDYYEESQVVDYEVINDGEVQKSSIDDEIFFDEETILLTDEEIPDDSNPNEFLVLDEDEGTEAKGLQAVAASTPDEPRVVPAKAEEKCSKCKKKKAEPKPEATPTAAGVEVVVGGATVTAATKTPDAKTNDGSNLPVVEKTVSKGNDIIIFEDGDDFAVVDGTVDGAVVADIQNADSNVAVQGTVNAPVAFGEMEFEDDEEGARLVAERARLQGELENLTAEKEALENEKIRITQIQQTNVEACDEVKDWVAAEGTTLRSLLLEWGDRVGWRVIWNMDRDYTLEAGAIFRGRFVDVAAALLRSFARAVPAPKGVFYKGNKVLVVSTREDENAD